MSGYVVFADGQTDQLNDLYSRFCDYKPGLMSSYVVVSAEGQTDQLDLYIRFCDY